MTPVGRGGGGGGGAGHHATSYAVHITMKTESKMRGLPLGAPKINILLKIFCCLALSI